jgi:2-dehydro-3-deoxyphosphogluconate aldolase / (4S)-4-hydroxy-2-oxoglutarate aldolase
MKAHDGMARIFGTGPVIAVVTIDRAADAVPLAQALSAGGIRVIEVTLRTPAALAAIAAIAAMTRRGLDAIVGAGTVRTAEDMLAAGVAGAHFLVSPGYTEVLNEAARAAAVPWLPGVATASEIMRAHGAGHAHLKFFPAEAAGGQRAVRAFATVFPEVVFCPTGGVDAQNAPAYLALPNVGCVGGSWVAPAAAIARGDWDEIQELASRAAPLGSAT